MPSPTTQPTQLFKSISVEKRLNSLAASLSLPQNYMFKTPNANTCTIRVDGRCEVRCVQEAGRSLLKLNLSLKPVLSGCKLERHEKGVSSSNEGLAVAHGIITTPLCGRSCELTTTTTTMTTSTSTTSTAAAAQRQHRLGNAVF